MKICPKCGSTKVIYFDSDNDMCESCKEWFPAVGEIPVLSKEKITQLAHDVWAVAKKLENVSVENHYTEINELKRISSSLHDIRKELKK